VLKERLPKEVRLNGTCSSGADDDFPDSQISVKMKTVSRRTGRDNEELRLI